ncbi:MAG: nuclear transport factor 2 family protein [Myxococcota bacterium]
MAHPADPARLADREAIAQLKARYFRLLDTKDWEAFGDVFTADARMQNGPEGQPPVEGRAAIVDYVRRGVADLVTTHQGHTPEIEFASADEARGVWAMTDRLRGPGGFAVDGWGHYHETYRRGRDGRWRIASTRLTRLRVEGSNPAVVRSLWPDAPDWAIDGRE